MNDIKSLKIADLKLLVKPLTVEELPSWIEQLRSDERSAVQKLSVQLEKRLSQYHAETEKSELMLIYEKQAMKQGFLYVAGIDEAGRGQVGLINGALQGAQNGVVIADHGCIRNNGRNNAGQPIGTLLLIL